MQHEHHRVPVTALSRWGRDVVLSGEGTFLNAYHIPSRTLLRSLAIFDGQQIHGIITGSCGHDAVVLTWGRRFIRKVIIEQNVDGSISFFPGRVHQTSDWILDVALAPPSDQHTSRAAILTAHNALSIWNLDDDNEDGVRLDPIVPGSNCILYSAHVQWLSVFKCLIAAGTAFGDVMIWSCFLSEKEQTLSAQFQTHHAFSAHEGSVFGVHLSSDEVAAAVDGRQHLLASCSDDRTIKLWDVSDLSNASPTLGNTQRETGFGAKQIDDTHAPLCLGKVMAHVSRIWHVRMMVENSTQAQSLGQFRLLSFGEDASYNIWSLASNGEVGSTTAYNLTQLQVQRPHLGKNIWSLDVDNRHGVVTGGADGAIVLSALASRSNHHENRLEIGPPAANNGRSEKFKSYVFTSLNELVATTEQGQVHLLKVDATTGYTMCELSPPKNGLRGYSLLSACSGIAFVAGVDGAVCMCSPADLIITELFQTDKKVTGLFSQALNDTPDDRKSVAVLATNIHSTYAIYSTLGQEAKVAKPGLWTLFHQHRLQLVNSSAVTSFAVWEFSSYTYVVLGTRNGSILVYDVTLEQSQPVRTKASMQAIHGREAVTALRFASDVRASQDHATLFSTGRDGTYAAHILKIGEDSVRCETVHQLSLPFGPNIEGVDYSAAGDLWIWGFRSTYFVVYNIKTEQELLVIDCGGANRSWAFQSSDRGGNFVWTKTSKLFCERKDEALTTNITPGEHGRDIKTVSISPTSPYIIATGSEDTNIKLSTYDTDGFVGLRTLKRHNTGIQHLQWSHDGKFLFSSGGFEELFIWKITPGVADISIGVICESAHPECGKSDLRITTFHAKPRSSQPQVFDITALYSDSSVKTWQYASSTRQWTLLARGDYLTSCPTQCLDLGPGRFLSASTDGHLATWTSAPGADLRWSHCRALHQNAILSLVAHRFSHGSSTLVFSGGDDNALALTRYDDGPGDDDDAETDESAGAATLVIPHAHAAAITGLVVFEDRRQQQRPGCQGVWLVSAGIDQRVKLWRIEVDLAQPGVSGVEIRRGASVFTSVADVAGLARMPLRKGRAEGVLVVGVGMDVWRLDCLEG